MRFRLKNPTTQPSLKRLALVALALCAALPASAEQPGAQPAQSVRQACAADYRSFCPGVKLGGGRAAACLEQNAAKLSPSCQQALSAAKAARQTPRSGS